MYEEILEVLDKTFKPEWGQKKVKKAFKQQSQQVGKSMTDYFDKLKSMALNAWPTDPEKQKHKILKRLQDGLLNPMW